MAEIKLPVPSLMLPCRTWQAIKQYLGDNLSGCDLARRIVYKISGVPKDEMVEIEFERNENDKNLIELIEDVAGIAAADFGLLESEAEEVLHMYP